MADSFDRPSPDTAPRREPLPWQEPKSATDDPDAPERVRKLLASPNYRPADSDFDFLNGEDTRGVRLEIDYLKAELELRRRGVEHTIVVFGSTRIGEAAAAAQITLHELSTKTESLEDAFLSATADSQEYRSGGPS